MTKNGFSGSNESVTKQSRKGPRKGEICKGGMKLQLNTEDQQGAIPKKRYSNGLGVRRGKRNKSTVPNKREGQFRQQN